MEDLVLQNKKNDIINKIKLNFNNELIDKIAMLIEIDNIEVDRNPDRSVSLEEIKKMTLEKLRKRWQE